MPSGRLTESQLAALQPGQAVTFQQYDSDSGRSEERRGVIGHVPLPSEHPQVCSWGSNGAPYFGLFTDEHPGEVLLVDEREITAVLSPADPTQKERLTAWLASRRPAALRRQRAELASQLAEVWMQSPSRQPAGRVSAVPYRSDRGPAYKILGENGQRVGEFLLPHGPLRMRVEALRGPASSVLSAHGVAVPGVSLHRPFANAGCVVRFGRTVDDPSRHLR